MANELPKYTFLPWLRKGIANQINEAENKGVTTSSDAKLRASVAVKLNVKGNGRVIDSVQKSVNLIGPGDIIGLSNQAVVRIEPADGIANFEPNYLASIEFYDEDFAWRYSPAVANNKEQLRPWLFLVLLKENEFEKQDPTEGVLPSIKIKDDGIDGKLGRKSTFLPKSDEIASWAHVHVNRNLNPNESDSVEGVVAELTTLINSNPDLAISRIVCPRKLEQNTGYHAFLIPSYETGRLAGLGADNSEIENVSAQASSWGNSSDIHGKYENIWPVYFNWHFQTGDSGDFEYLVRQLKPRAVDHQVGRRPMDIQDPGYDLSYKVKTEAGIKTTLSLEGALTVPGSVGESYPYPDMDTNKDFDVVKDTKFINQLEDLVNLGEDVRTATNLSNTTSYYGNVNVEIAGSNVEDDPIIAPPLYGRWHAMVDRVMANGTNPAGWVNELNLDPRNRVVAGFGAAVVKANQDALLDHAWEQVGDVVAANKKLHWAQLARETSRRMYLKNIESQPDEKFLALTGKMKRRILNTDTVKTYYQVAKESSLPLAMEDRAMRRIMRPAGPVMKNIDPLRKINQSKDKLVDKLDKGVVLMAAKKEAPVLAQTTNLSKMEISISAVAKTNTANYNYSMVAIGKSVNLSSVKDNGEAVRLKEALLDYGNYFKEENWKQPLKKPVFGLAEKASDIKTHINPLLTIANKVNRHLVLDRAQGRNVDKIIPILAYPKYLQPMYESLRDLSTELLIPNLNLVPNNTITLLETNQKFIESYMVGLNHEMGRELLWREFPADQRGSYFRQFWNVVENINVDYSSEEERHNALSDINELHRWKKNTVLGSHKVSTASLEKKPVLLIRGDLLKKYPNAVIYAIKAAWQKTNGKVDYTKARIPVDGKELFPIFSANINPDITFLGFDSTVPKLRGGDPDNFDSLGDDTNVCDPGYFFVIKERPGEVRFGMDIDNNTRHINSWDDLHWGMNSNADRIELDVNNINPSNKTIPSGGNDAPRIEWNKDINAAELAMVLYQNPFMASIHAREMLQSV